MLICETSFNFGFLLSEHLLFLFEFIDVALNFVNDLFGFIEVFAGADKNVMDLFSLIVEFVGLSEISFFRVFDNFGGVIGSDLR